MERHISEITVEIIMDYENHVKKQKNIEPVPYIAYESAIARLERINKRVWAINIILNLALLFSNLAWLIWG